MINRRSFAVLGLAGWVILLSGCETDATGKPLEKGGVYLFEMKKVSADKHNLPTAFRGAVIKIKPKGEDELLSIRLRGVTREVLRSAFSKITVLNPPPAPPARNPSRRAS